MRQSWSIQHKIRNQGLTNILGVLWQRKWVTQSQCSPREENGARPTVGQSEACLLAHLRSWHHTPGNIATRQARRGLGTTLGMDSRGESRPETSMQDLLAQTKASGHSEGTTVWPKEAEDTSCCLQILASLDDCTVQSRGLTPEGSLQLRVEFGDSASR